MPWTSYAIKTVTGAIVGYTTNDLAIQMLFKRRFGLGGIFLRTHDEFVENISKLVERDIINHHTLYPKLEDETFRLALQKTVQTYLDEQLKQAVPQNLRLGQIPQFEKASQDIRAHLNEQLPLTVEPILFHLSKQTSIGEFVSEEQWLEISRHVLHELVEGVKEWSSIEKLLKDFLDEVKEKSPADFIAKELQEFVSKEAQVLLRDLHLLLESQYQEDISSLINQLFTDLELEQLLEKLAERISQKRIIDILGEEKALAIGDQLLGYLKEILSKEEGIKIIDTFSNFLIQTLEKEEKTVFDLLAPNAKNQLELFFKNQFPRILVKVIGWLYSRQKELEKLIDETFKNNIESRFKSWIVEVFVGSISQSADVIGRVTSIIDSYRRNPEQVAKDLTEQVITYLEDKSIGEMVSSLKSQNTVLSLSKLLNKNIHDALERLDAKPLISLFLERKISGLVPIERLLSFLQTNLQKVKDELTTKIIFNPSFSQGINEEVQKRLQAFLETPFEDLLGRKQKQRFAESLEALSVDAVIDNKEKLQELLAEVIARKVNSFGINRLVSAEQLTEISELLSKRVDDYALDFLEKQQSSVIRDYFIALEDAPDISEDLGKVLHKFLLQNLDTLLTGRIEEVVRLNLSRQSPQQIRDIVERFMGKELKPITTLGALWGGLAGGALAAVPSLEPLGLNYGVSAAAYGATGWATNWLALKMIFRPYSKKFVPNTKVPIPLTPGVVIKNRERFAHSMSNFVGDKLMKKEGLKETFEQSKERIGNATKDWITGNNFQRIYTYLEDHQHILAKNLSQKSWDYVQANQAELLSLLEGGLLPYQNITLEEIDTASFEQTILNYLKEDDMIAFVSEKFGNLMEEYLSENQTIEEVLPSSLRDNLNNIIGEFLTNELQSFLDNLNSEEQIEKLLANLGTVFQNKTKERTPSDFLSQEQVNSVEKHLSSYLINELNNENTQSKVFGFIHQQIENQISPDKKIGELFNGSLIRLLNTNINFIIQKMIEGSADWLSSNSEQVANQVYEKVYEEQKAAFIYKNAIKATTKELATEGIPNFLQKEIKSVSSLVQTEVERMGEISLEKVGIELSPTYIENTIANLLKRENTQQPVHSFTSELLRSLFQTPIATFIAAAGIESLELSSMGNLQFLLISEFRLVSKHLQKHFEEHKEALLEKPKSLAINILESVLQKDDNFLKRLDKDALNRTINLLVTKVFQSTAFDTQGRRVIALVFERIKKQQASSLINWDVFIRDLTHTVEKNLSGASASENKILFEEGLAVAIQKNAIPILKAIPVETKTFIIDIFVNAGLNALQEELPDLLASIPIKDIVVQEISKMPPKEIEELFDSFAKKYFDRLVQYGFGFGLGFGLILDGGITAAQTLL